MDIPIQTPETVISRMWYLDFYSDSSRDWTEHNPGICVSSRMLNTLLNTLLNADVFLFVNHTCEVPTRWGECVSLDLWVLLLAGSTAPEKGGRCTLDLLCKGGCLPQGALVSNDPVVVTNNLTASHNWLVKGQPVKVSQVCKYPDWWPWFKIHFILEQTPHSTSYSGLRNYILWVILTDEYLWTLCYFAP